MRTFHERSLITRARHAVMLRRPGARRSTTMPPKLLWSIRTTQRLTDELWWQFVTKTRETGTTPAHVLEDFILGYIAKEDGDDKR